jgi:hypothetical protein
MGRIERNSKRILKRKSNVPPYFEKKISGSSVFSSLITSATAFPDHRNHLLQLQLVLLASSDKGWVIPYELKILPCLYFTKKESQSVLEKRIK